MDHSAKPTGVVAEQFDSWRGSPHHMDRNADGTGFDAYGLCEEETPQHEHGKSKLARMYAGEAGFSVGCTFFGIE